MREYDRLNRRERFIMVNSIYCLDEDKLLTERELEVLVCLYKGLTNPEIADKLCITVSTVKAHMSKILHKTGAKSRVDVLLMLTGLLIIPKEDVKNQIKYFNNRQAFPMVK